MKGENSREEYLNKNMKKLLEKYELNLTEKELSKFEKFLEIFIEKNSQINLSAIRDADGIIEKHFIDSIMLAIFYDVEWKVADMGTGWVSQGLP